MEFSAKFPLIRARCAVAHEGEIGRNGQRAKISCSEGLVVYPRKVVYIIDNRGAVERIVREDDPDENPVLRESRYVNVYLLTAGKHGCGARNIAGKALI